MYGRGIGIGSGEMGGREVEDECTSGPVGVRPSWLSRRADQKVAEKALGTT